MSIKGKIGFKALLNTLQVTTREIPDKREQDKVKFSLWDIVGSAFAMMFFEDPSLLHFQRRMKDKMNKCNLETMFNVLDIPKDNRIRTILDQIKPYSFNNSFCATINNFYQSGELEKFKFMGKYLCLIDASQNYSSTNIYCKHCLKKKHKKDGTTTYSHQVLVPLIVHPDKKQILPLMPEEIKNEDGKKKQDCELNGAKRLIPKLKTDFPALSFIVAGDALYANQSFIELVREQEYSFILTAKEGNNKTLFAQIKGTNLQKKEITIKDRRYEYEWVNNLNLNLSKETIKVNYFTFRIIDIKTGEITHKNSWITDLKIDENNVEALVKAGRSRWKIENECFNILKNNGYEMEHNYGHGKQYLSFNFFILTLLSLLFHQIHLLVDEMYQQLREASGSMKRFWDKLKGAITLILFESWEQLLRHALNPPDIYSTA